MKKSKCSILFFLITFSFYAFSQQRDVSIDLVSKNLSFKPGKINTQIIKLKNYTEEKTSFSTRLILPESWRIITQLTPINLNSGASGIQILSIKVPGKYLAGVNSIRVEVFETESPEVVINEIIWEVIVEEEVGLSVELVSSPEFVKAGELIEASFVVRNIGNTTQSITLIPNNCEIEGSIKADIAPGASSIVNVTTLTDPELSFPTRKSLSLTAKASDNFEKLLYHFVKIIPGVQSEKDLYHRLPVNVATRVLSKGAQGQFQVGYQFEILSSGSLDPDGKHQVELIARGPNQFDLSLLGMYDQYFVGYKNEKLSLKFGDNSYGLTPLTEMSRYGFGFQNEYNITKSALVGVMFVKPKFYGKMKSEYGLYSKYEISEDNTIGTYYVRKMMQEDVAPISLFSITSSLNPFPKTNIDIEISRGYQDNIADNAIRASLSSQLSKIMISSFYYHTGKNYPGYYSSSTFYSGFANYQATNWLSFGLSARQDFSNAELDTLYSTAPFSRQYQGMVSLKLGKKMFFKTFMRKYERKDRLPQKKFHYENTSINTHFAHRLRKFNYRLVGEYGLTRNLLDNALEKEKYTFRTSANASYRPNEKHNFMTFLSYSTMSSFISKEQSNWIFGISAYSQISKNLKANAQIQNTFAIEDYYKNRNLLQLNIEYSFLKKHRLALNSFYTIFQNEVSNPDYTFAFTYSVDFGIPMKQVEEAGSLLGKIENAGVESTSGIILYLNGKSAITNEEGVFSFKNLVPGKYTLLMDRSTVNMLDISDIETPIEVEITGNVETVLNFGLTKAAKLEGKIQVQKTKMVTKLLDGGDIYLGHIVLELNRENESYRIITNQDGSFVFPLMRPGKWFLKVYKNGIDKQYILERDHFELDISPGEIKTLDVNIRKKKRNIIFMNKSVNLSSGKK